MGHDPAGGTRDGILALSEREKETLRRLLGGHDAKSIARDLGLSVHTVNERLREARRKLGVSSSREAARRLAEAERATPNSLGNKEFGVAPSVTGMPKGAAPDRRGGAGHSLAWLGGGMLIMSLVIAAVALSFHGSATVQAPVASVATASEAESADAARAWIALVDQQKWGASWDSAGTQFQSQVTKADWASNIETVRAPLGAVTARTFQSVTRASSLPGAPAGEYEVLQFQTSFAKRPGTAETIILVREGAAWKVVGYFIR